ncbi:MAG TPA: hypothetical protein VG779_11495 [Actinomycetota bacterium]|nr:hypothetical protein [Actinomycetota bacterium]
MTDRPERNDIEGPGAESAERGWALSETLPGGGVAVRELPGPDPFWLTLLATLSALVIPAGTAIGAVLLLGPPNIPHPSKLATIAADALTLAEAVFAGLVVGALVEAGWTRVHLPGSGPADYLPVRWARRRIARRRLMALSPGTDGGGGRSGRIPRLCAEVGRRSGLSGAECERARVAALVDRGVEQMPASRGATEDGRLRRDESPASERLAAVVGAYDALRSDQPDRPALSRRDALEELRAMAGVSLEPDIVEALIEVETPRRRLMMVPLLGLLGPPLSGLVRRGRHIARTSVTPAAAAATVLAMLVAGLMGVLPAWRGTRVLALRYPAPSVVVQTTPTPTSPDDATLPPATPAPSQAPSPAAPSPNGSGTGTGPVGRAPGLYFPPQRSAGAPSARPTGTAPAANGQPAPTPTIVYFTEVPAPITVGVPSPSATPAPTPTTSTPPAPSGVVADRVVSSNNQGAFTALVSPLLSTTSANELILAFVSTDGPGNGVQSAGSVSGGGLSWSLAARANTVTGTAEVWQAYATTPLTGASVVATLGSSGRSGCITVAAFRGAAPAVGATAVAGAASGAPQVAVTPTKAGSLLWAVGQDPDRAAPRTPLGGQSVVHESFGLPGGGTAWVQATGRVAAANPSITMGDSAPTIDRWDLAAVEIPPDH